MEDRLTNLRLKRQSIFNSHRQSQWINPDLDQKQKAWKLLDQFLNPKSAEESVSLSS
jgi:hypothetical protein